MRLATPLLALQQGYSTLEVGVLLLSTPSLAKAF
jgi:hypothetical protein